MLNLKNPSFSASEKSGWFILGLCILVASFRELKTYKSAVSHHFRDGFSESQIHVFFWKDGVDCKYMIDKATPTGACAVTIMNKVRHAVCLRSGVRRAFFHLQTGGFGYSVLRLLRHVPGSIPCWRAQISLPCLLTHNSCKCFGCFGPTGSWWKN